MASGATSTYGLPYPLSTDGVDVAGDMADLAVSVEGVLITKASNADVALKAPIASPTFTGTPLLTNNPAADDNTTKIASTAFVIGQASSTTPVMDGVAAVGTSLRYARANHVHPSDTTKANLSGATFTGSVIFNASASFSSSITAISASFSGAVTGIAPTSDNHLATKAYVDSNTNSFFLMGA